MKRDCLFIIMSFSEFNVQQDREVEKKQSRVSLVIFLSSTKKKRSIKTDDRFKRRENEREERQNDG